MASHNVLQFRSAEIRPGRRERVEARQVFHRIAPSRRGETGSGVTEPAYTENGLVQLAAAARRDLARLNYPPSNWVLPATGPDRKTALDVLVVGAGMCGQTAAFALLREGVTNIRIVDRAPRGLEGPWGTFARMETLRSPKHLTGPDLGIASLTFRAWFEAQHGEGGWRDLYKVARLDWLAYLIWVRDAVGIPVENETEVRRLFPAGGRIGGG